MGGRWKLYLAMPSALLSLVGLLVLLTRPTDVAQAVIACTQTVSNTNDNGSGSLRSALQAANASPDTDKICFNISSSPKVILPLSQLPAITQPAILDATTQTGYTGAPLISIDGSSAGNSVGMWITAGNSQIRGLAIYNFELNGIIITDNPSNKIAGNYIGLTAGGSAAGNGTDGVGILNSASNTVGGTVAADRNVVSANTGNGIGVTGSNASGNIIQGNYVGTDPTGTVAAPNQGDGILINDSPATTIGGLNSTPGGECTGSCNLVSGNRVNGIGLWYANSRDSVIKGNYVGTDKSGTQKLANGDIGLEINETASNTVGGQQPGERNVFSGNLGAGIFITGGGSYSNRVIGNNIGSNATGTAAIPNTKMGLGIGYSPGIQPAHDNIIGTTTGKTTGKCDGECNIISGNSANGILLSSSAGNVITANYIGLQVNECNALGNGRDGVGLIDSSNNLFRSNVIAANGDNGIIITGANAGNRIESNVIGSNCVNNVGAGLMLNSGVDTAILGNSFTYNSKLGIDLSYDNVTLNDISDGDEGANRKQNFPEIYAVKSNGGGYYVSGTINSKPNTSYRLEFFQSTQCNAGKPLNYGEGSKYLGGLQTTTDQFGNKVYTFPGTEPLAGNTYITATATKMIGTIPAETSEFSICRLVNTSRPALTNGATWTLKDDLTPGTADKSFGYGFPATLLMCAWDANQKGVKLPVVVSGSNWYMRASYTTGKADLSFQYGFVGAKPICGDWDGDGVDTVGIFSGGNWYLRNSNTQGTADTAFTFGASDGRPVVGNWDGSGNDGIGVITVGSSLIWNLKNATSSGAADYTISYGGNSGTPIAGDWDGNGTTTVGVVYDGSKWELRNTNDNGAPQASFAFGQQGMTPVAW